MKMKKLLIFLFSILSIAAIAQPGSISQSVVRFRVNDSTAAISANVSPIAQGYSPMFWNNQATTPHWDVWNGSSYSHVFDFNGGSGIDGSTALNSYPTSHTLDAGDVNDFNDNGIIRFTISAPANLTVPLDATVNFDIPSQIGIDNQGSDTLTVVWTGGVTGNDGGYAEIFPGGSALLIKVAANEYDLLGTQPGGGGGGAVESVSGTTNRIESSGGVTPTIDISSTFEALISKRAERIDQNNAATTSAQLATTLSDESGTGVVAYTASPTFTGNPLAPTPSPGDNDTSIPTTAFVTAAIGASGGAAPVVNTFTADHTLAATDIAGGLSGYLGMIRMNLTGTANTVFIPTDASLNCQIGTEIEILQVGTGVTTVTATTPGTTTITPPSGGNATSPGQGQVMVAKKVAANSWTLQNGNAASALTKVDDTNVTVALTGNPSSSLLSAVGITLGWTGVLSVARGGSGLSAVDGTYTPTLTNTTNIAASTAYVTGWFRVGAMVTVFGQIDIDATLSGSTATELGVSLPVASNMTGEQDLGGNAISDAVASLSARVKGDPTNDRASIVFKALSLSNDSYSFEFSYQVK